MLITLYLLCAVAGGGLLLASLFGGHDTQGDSVGDAPHDVGGQDIDAASIASWFSLRSAIFFCAFFGATGLALHYIAETPELIGVALALAVGLASAAFARFVGGRVMQLGATDSGTARDSDMIGKEATVMLGIEASSHGRIRLDHAGTVVEMLADADGQTIDERDSVLIVDVKQGVAKVTRIQKV